MSEIDDAILRERLKLLSIFHYVVGGLYALFGLIPVIHLTLGIVFLTASATGAFPDRTGGMIMGGVFTVVALTIITIFETIAVCIIYAGRCISGRKRHLFCVVVAAISCILFPFGTILGIFTLIVLSKEETKILFESF